MDMDKLMRKIRVNARLAKLKTIDFAKAFGAKVNEAWNDAQEAANEYHEKVNKKIQEMKENKDEEKKCNCGCCHCHDEEKEEDNE